MCLLQSKESSDVIAEELQLEHLGKRQLYSLAGYSTRLVGSAYPWEGIVEFSLNGVPGTICHNEWDDLDATVVCRQLGFSLGGRAEIDIRRFAPVIILRIVLYCLMIIGINYSKVSICESL